MAIGISRHGSTLLTTGGDIGIPSKPKIIYGMHIFSSSPAAVVAITDTASTITYITEVGLDSKGFTIMYGEGFFFPNGAFYSSDGNQISVLFSYDEVSA